MESITATNTLHTIFNFLDRNDITLSEVINYGVQFDSADILPNSFDINEEWDDDKQDYEAMKLLPEKYKDCVCIRSTPDGNCFFNSASLIVFGNENFNIQLRLAVMVELMIHSQFYLQQKIFEQDIIYREEALNSGNSRIINNNYGFKKESEYISELKLMCKPNSWNSMIAFFGLASVLHRPIESLFPNTNNKFMNQIYNRIILPRQNTKDLPKCIIMWSSCSAKQFQMTYQANHFVPVFKRKNNFIQDLPFSQNNFIDLSIFKDDELLVMQNCLSIAKDKEPVYDEIKCEDYNYNFQSVYNDDDDNYQSSIKNDHQLQPVIENDKRKQNQNLAGLFMGIDSSFIPNVENINGYLIYQEAKDFQFTITRKDALDKLILCVIDDQEPNYYWRSWQVSNYYLVELLRKQSEFPPQISITVKKTYESNKILTKYCYCGGCNINEKVTFKIAINKLDLISSENLVNISVIFSLNKNQCKHLEGKTFGQCRGLSRQKLMEFDCKSPRNIRKQILSTVKSEIRYTGNRQGIPSANSARMINSAKKTNKQLGYNLCERLHAAILDINRKEKDEFLRINGSKSAVKRRIWGFIQEPIQTQPLSIPIFNEAAIVYYHDHVHENPGIFLDYTGQLVKSIPYCLTSINNTTENYKRILNAFFTMPLLGKKSDAPPVDVFELVTNDLSANNLQHYLHIYRQKELQLFNSNSVPYLINTDCARNLLVAVLKEYNNETPEQYFNRIINTIITNEEFDSSKVLVGWCYGHAIRAVRHHIRSKKFTIEEGGSREILAKFAMRVWNSVRVKENIDEIENEIDRWEWLMIQKNLELINKRVSLIKKNRFRDNFGEISLHDLPSIDFESNQNLEDLDLAVYPQNLPLNSDKINNTWTYTIMGDPLLKIIQNYNSYELLILQLGININVQLDITTQSIINPFYSINLKNYLERFWWKTIILWSNLIPAIKNRTRRTTATVEVENNIVKNFDIGKKNLPIDEYIYVRTQTLKSTQNLIAERLMCRSFGQQNQDQNELNEQWQPKKKRTFTNEESRIIKNFKIVMDYRKNTDSPSQYRIAREIREISTQNIGFNQSMVSRLYNGIDIPKCDRTITAINNWIDKELEKKENQENLNREII
ncbi:uncharacterized protein OCT59_004738 [Rhizophagus irregularis]|uniref:Vertnin n=1 Tax=Rhizophagus irregularis (strain DAOM 197198w) TaxID=1432141 RepID=A0A015L972_RHIIW|nr:hypothetical protein RirG_099130 [Rhizophagus irregularis DAOM 197198w]UZO10870.1 hypothetical protein OCT59_002448 [Rhizophagus irregularis]UZO13234.1 hypothetical protein OCT59_004738 [Rhizophagus irregularis]GBC18036.1 vertnin isoform X2 [Rhizophagus irregularis DAOM 181602=DAOM 197198]